MSVLFAPLEDNPELRAALYLHGVLPAFEDLLHWSETARSVLGGRDFTLRLEAPGELRARLRFHGGRCEFHSDAVGRPDCALRFLSAQQLVNQFSGDGFSLPLPVVGFWRLGALRAFAGLSEQLKTSIESLDSAEGSDLFCALQMNLSVSLAAGVMLLKHERFSQELFKGVGDWSVAIRVEETDVAGWVQCESGSVRWGRGACEGPPSGELVFQDTRVAARAMSGQVDAFAEVNAGAISVSGYTPLVDKLSVVLDRVNAYLRVV